MTYRLAGYRGRGRPIDWVIRAATFSIYSHVEIVSPLGVWWSSSKRDGGVRWKRIDPKPGHWDFVALPNDIGTRAAEYIRRRKGTPYDLKGAVLGPVFGIQPDDTRDSLFCSEVIAPALGWSDAWTMTPGAQVARATRMWGL